MQTIGQAKVKELQRRVERLESVISSPQPQPQPYGPRRMVGVHQKPEDIVRLFMMKGFTGGDFIHDQVALQHSNWKRDVLLTPFPSSMYV
ncbi:uncharacterized protein M6B38_192000 [Iris pallida]|uniref:Uncharacterized protein n=1 Tax=Iris pallida TaxID=29817 RepID=A0AAX6EES6_IRIPA|nr:uncharacterized protein M6B38_192000 [Iris pallida]